VPRLGHIALHPVQGTIEPNRAWTGFVVAMTSGANPTKVEDVGDKDLLQHIDLARILFGEVIFIAPGGSLSQGLAQRNDDDIARGLRAMDRGTPNQ
jgi:hypothetical protein